MRVSLLGVAFMSHSGRAFYVSLIHAPHPIQLLMQTYNQTRHDHEITMEKQTVVELVEDDQNENEIPQIQYHVSLLTICT